MKIYFLLLSTLFASLLSLCTQAEIYKWTDENGKVHFGDRPPSSSGASNISHSVKDINISTDLSSPEMMRDVQNESREKQEKKRREAYEQKEKQASLKEYCEQARLRLWQVQGPVVFLDENGKALKATEKERQQREKKLLQEIKQKCD